MDNMDIQINIWNDKSIIKDKIRLTKIGLSIFNKKILVLVYQGYGVILKNKIRLSYKNKLSSLIKR